MRRLALPLSLLVVACGDDALPQTSDTDDTRGSSSSTTAPSTESGSSESSGLADSSSSDATLDPTTESSTTEPVDPDTSTGEEPPAVCGDGMITGNEICDGNNFADNTCQSQGFQNGVLTCSGDCLGFSTSSCFICGDGEIAGTEECDGPLDNDMDCEGLGYTEGSVNCDMSTCELDVSGCTLCGDGVAQGNEFCDIDDLFDETCESLGFDGGTLGCHDNCGFDYSGCTGGMYMQDFESCMMPPEFSFAGNAEWSADMTNPITGTCSAHNDDIGESQSAAMILDTLWAIDGTCDFMQRTDSEGNFDYLEFYVDGVLLNAWSGTGGAAAAASFDISAGNHTLEWRYVKDSIVTSGSDTVWVDDIVLFGGVPI